METEQAWMREAGRAFGEDVLEALIWDAVEDALLALGPGGRSDGWAEGLEAWGRELLARWPDEVAGFVEAFVEDDRAGRLDRLRARLREVTHDVTRGVTLGAGSVVVLPAR